MVSALWRHGKPALLAGTLLSAIVVADAAPATEKAAPTTAEAVPAIDCTAIYTDDRFLPLARAALFHELQADPHFDSALLAELGGKVPASAVGISTALLRQHADSMQGAGPYGRCYRLSARFYLERQARPDRGARDYILHDVRHYGAPLARRVVGIGSGNDRLVVLAGHGRVVFVETDSDLRDAVAMGVVEAVAWREGGRELGYALVAESEDYSMRECEAERPDPRCTRDNTLRWLVSGGRKPAYEQVQLPHASSPGEPFRVTSCAPDAAGACFRLEVAPGGQALHSLEYRVNAQGRLSAVRDR